MKIAKYTMSLLLTSVLAACGGTGGMLPAHSVPQAKTGNATVRIVIPQNVANSQGQRSSDYVSASTKALVLHVITVNGNALSPAFPDVVMNVAPGSTNCPFPTTGNPQTCTFSVSLPVGSVNMTATAYDQTQTAGAAAVGNTLSSATLTQTLTGAGDNVNLTLNGVLKSVTLAVSKSSITLGVPSSVAITATGYDAQGNVIVGPGNYTTPIALSVTDTTGRLTLASPSITAPGQSVNLNYSGAYGLSLASVSGAFGSVATNSLSLSWAPALIGSVVIPASYYMDSFATIGISPDGSKIVVNAAQTGYANSTTSTASNVALIYSVTSNQFLTSIPFGVIQTAAYQGVSGNVAFSNDGSTAYLPWIAGNTNSFGGIAAISVTNGTLTADSLDGNTTSDPNYYAVAVRPGSTTLYAEAYTVTGVNVISTTNGAVTKTITGPSCARQKGQGGYQCLAVSADGSTLYATNYGGYQSGGAIDAINASTGTVSSTIQSSPNWPFAAQHFLAYGPTSIALSPDGSKLYVVNNNNPSSQIACSGSGCDPNNADIGAIATTGLGYSYIGGKPAQYDGTTATVSPDGADMVLTGAPGTYIVDTGTGATMATMPSAYNPRNAAFIPSTHKYYQVVCNYSSNYGGPCNLNEYQY